jgi:hypothetical protein
MDAATVFARSLSLRCIQMFEPLFGTLLAEVDSASFDVNPRLGMINSPYSSRLRCTALEELPLGCRPLPANGLDRAKCRQSTRSLDNFIGSHEQVVRYDQAKCLCCQQIDDHLEFGGLHDR